MNNTLIKEVDALFKGIENEDIYKNYVNVKKQLYNNKDIMDIINQIKKYQKMVVNKNDEEIEKKLKKLYKNLNDYPIYQSYKEIKEELNDELTFVKDTLEAYFKSVLKI